MFRNEALSLIDAEMPQSERNDLMAEGELLTDAEADTIALARAKTGDVTVAGDRSSA
jgi:hypothetical protein